MDHGPLRPHHRRRNSTGRGHQPITPTTPVPNGTGMVCSSFLVQVEKVTEQTGHVEGGISRGVQPCL